LDRLVSRPEVLAIVQARGGSKGLPRKNVRFLRGHPLVAYSIASGRAAKSITRLIVSTDDDEIAAVAAQYGAEVPFRRPPDLAADDTPDFPLFVHALNWLEANEKYRPDAIVQLRPTTPFRPRGMLDEAIRILHADPQVDCVRGVTAPKQTPYKMWRDAGDGYLAPLMETPYAEPYNMPRQKLPQAYWQTGHVDAIRTTTIRQQHSLTGRRVRPIQVDLSYCVDIDTPADFELAEQIIDQKRLDIDLPHSVAGLSTSGRRPWPSRIDLAVFDFDGVFTDNRVLTLEDGREAILCDRGDGMGISLLKRHGVEMIVLSTELNPVVTARCRKLQIPCRQGLADKAVILAELLCERDVAAEHVIYVGNDVNDAACMKMAGYAVTVADAHPTALELADLVLTKPGGQGAVRELCDLILAAKERADVENC
jgi:YrbI family 3-deoxy-D-manno-octulosonate 8-phosphate phosphatase